MAPNYLTTARRALRYLAPGNRVKDLAPALQSLATDIDGYLLTKSFGKCIIPAAETRRNSSYGLMPTPDKVPIVMPADGVIAVLYQATWNQTTNGAGASIFVGANQVKRSLTALGFPTPAEASLASGRLTDAPLASCAAGLLSDQDNTVASYSGDVTTGQVVGLGTTASPAAGGVCWIFAPAGSYDVSIQYKNAGGVTAKDRKLWVWSLGF